jgi:hypothetical protein
MKWALAREALPLYHTLALELGGPGEELADGGVGVEVVAIADFQQGPDSVGVGLAGDVAGKVGVFDGQGGESVGFVPGVNDDVDRLEVDDPFSVGGFFAGEGGGFVGVIHGVCSETKY